MRNNPNSFQVLQNLGTDMNIKIGSTVAFDQAVIQGDSAGQGVFITEHQNATQVLAIAASDPTNDRIDNVILRIYDDTFDSSGFDYADIEVTTGTPDASPVAPAVPAGSFVLAEILVQNAVTQIVNGDITDKRVEAPVRGELVKTIYYTADDTFTKADHPWLHKIRVRLVGGGGGGGGVDFVTSGEGAGAGGGGGGYAEEEILEETLGTTETVTVGDAGTAGAAGGGGGTGGTGQSSTFGALLTGAGGTGGAGMTSATDDRKISLPGVGGAGSGGDLHISGEDGGYGEITFARTLRGHRGGRSQLSNNPREQNSFNAVGVAGRLYGGGGGGAVTDLTDLAGGAGAAGIVIVDLYA